MVLTMVTHWKTHQVISLHGLEVELSEPVLVKRSRWYCWFPSLIRQPNGNLWAVMSAYADMHASNSINYLSRSRDGGLSWDEPRVIGDGGLAHLLLPDGAAVILPYYLRPRPNGMGAPCNVLSIDGELAMRPAGVEVSGWPRATKSPLPEVGISGFVFNGQVVRGRDGQYLATLYGTFEGDQRYSLAFVESVDGFHWRWRSLVAGPDCNLEVSDGHCESAVCSLVDGRLMCVFRLASFTRYGQTFSADDGHTWSAPVNIAPGSVEPSLAVLQEGIVALSGGRSGIYVWFNVDGSGRDWQPVDIVSAHNAASPPADRIEHDSHNAWSAVDEMRRTGITGFSSCYTELAALDQNTLLLTYDRVGFGWRPIPDDADETKSVWVMRIRIRR
jgi:hypothetical protein